MPSIFAYEDYKGYLSDLVKTKPRRGRGVLSKIAIALGITSSTLSRILRGRQHLTDVQAFRLARILEHSEHETQYLLALVRLGRAESTELHDFLLGELLSLRTRQEAFTSSSCPNHALTAEDQIEFYSDWTFAAVHLASFLEAKPTAHSIAARLGISLQKCRRTLQSLKRMKLIVENREIISPQPISTRIEGNPHVQLHHHRNWRVKGLAKIPDRAEIDLFFSSPMLVNRADAQKIRRVLEKTIDQMREIRAETKGDSLFCLNIDWFEF